MARKRVRSKKKRLNVNPLSASETVKHHLVKFEEFVQIDIPNQYSYILSSFSLNLQDNACSYFAAQCLYVHFKENSDDCFICWEEVSETKESQVGFSYGKCQVPFEVLNAIKSKRLFNLSIDSENTTKGHLFINLSISPKLILPLIFASDRSHLVTELRSAVKLALLYFLGVSTEEYEKVIISNKIDIEELYAANKNCFNHNIKSQEVAHLNLAYKLREYQAQAVQWMIKSETEFEKDNDNNLHILYEEIKTKDGHTLYYHKYEGIFVTNKFEAYPLCKGGILADEMGLGKTVEVLACILLNPRTDLKTYKQSGPQEQYVNVLKCNTDSFSVSLTNNQPPKLCFKRLSQAKENDDKKRRYCSEANLLKTCQKCGAKLNTNNNDLCPLCFDGSFKVSSVNENSTSSSSTYFTEEIDKQNLLDRNYWRNNSDDTLECICGKTSRVLKMLECYQCGLKQHAKCVLTKPDISDVNYLCPYCWVDSYKKPVLSRATLIVSPSAILFQWNQEIEKHIKEGKLKVFQYLGLEHHKFINPIDLADHDIVLSSYETLKKELCHVNVPHGTTQRSLRHPKKFRSLPSPLSAIEWWRVCLDEAQMVESVHTKTTQMTLKLQCINRWCVTGTPIQKSFEDLYGLMVFLGCDPYQVKEWWNELITKPTTNGNTDNLICLLNKVLWRTSKTSVLDQIDIPQQETIIHKVYLSQIEKVFYDSLHEKCQRDFIQNVERYECEDVNLRFIDKQILGKILLPLRILHKSCNYFQLTGGRFPDIQKRKMTIPELLDFLLQKAARDAEEMHRKLILALNGLAGIYIISQDYRGSCEIYRRVLASVKETSMHIRTDVLQQVHAYHNYAEAVSRWSKISEENANIRDILEVEDIDYFINNLRESSNYLCEKYLQKFPPQISTCTRVLDEFEKEFVEINSKFKYKSKFIKTSQWWFNILGKLENQDKHYLVLKVKDTLMNAPGSTFLMGASVSDRFTDTKGLAHLLVTLSGELHETRHTLIHAVKYITSTLSADDIDEAIICHLRPIKLPSGLKAPKCKYCTSENILKRYEGKLFRFDEKVPSDDEPDLGEDSDFRRRQSRRGTHADSEFELILKEFLNCSRFHNECKMYSEDGVNELKLLDTMKREFKALSKTWSKMHEYVSAVDELEMAKTSMRLLKPGEKRPNPPVKHIILSKQVQEHMFQYQDDIIEHQAGLTKKLGHLFYLQNLEKTKNGSVPLDQLCPICHQAFENTWLVLQCGHNFCHPCVAQVWNHASRDEFNGFLCPVCREITLESDIYCTESNNDELKEVPIKGDFSAKISAVVKCLIDIGKDITAKCIVFSSWPDLLGSLADALTLNKIEFACISDNKSFQAKKLQKFVSFKQDPNLNVLLIPLNLGGNGLNIIEATHVLFIEPIMDNSKILQAIGRVHRIGQTKRTFVHKFVIRNTIDDNIFQIYDASSSTSLNVTPVTVNDLKKLFEEEE